jgi:hypothetical protein
VRELADANPEFREIGKRMLTEREQRALDITPTVTAKARVAETLKRSVLVRQVTHSHIIFIDN